MKKLITLLAIVMAWISQAQISQGNSLINLSVGFGLTTQASAFNGVAGITSTLKTKVPPVNISYEYAVQDNITVGIFGAYSAQQNVISYEQPGDPFDPNSQTETINITTDYKYAFVGGLANYHFDFIDNENFDLYAGIKLGYLSFSSETSVDLTDFPSNFGVSDISGIVYGGQLGLRYFFSDSLAAHLNLGYGVSYVNVGLTYKLGGY